MIDKIALQNELTDAFIIYQHRLDCPFQNDMESLEAMRLKYMNDTIFHAKVTSLVCGVMRIISKHA
jgi:hypothetical protein